MTMTAGSIFDFDESLNPGSITSDADIVALANGGFVIAGQSAGGVDGVIYNSRGKPIGSFNDQPGHNASVVQMSDGRIAVASEDAGTTHIRYYNSVTGAEDVGSRGVPFTNPGASNIDAAATSDGHLAVSYQIGSAQDSDIQFDIWNASGTRTETVLVDTSSANDSNASITVMDNGNIALAWTRTAGNGETAIFYAVYESDGDVVTGPTLIRDSGTVARNPSIVAVNGGFAIGYENNAQGTGSVDILVEQFDFDGVRQGGVFITNTDFANSGEGDGTQNSDAYLARSPDGNLGVTYTRDLNGNKDQVVSVLRDLKLVSGAQPEIDFPHIDDPNVDPILAFFGPGKIAALHTNTALGDLKGDIIHGFRDAFGDDDNDFFQGDDLEDLLNGLGGNDVLNGGNNDDELLGGDGSDTLHGNNGDDTLSGDGNAGDGDLGDKLFGDAGNDQLFGEAGNDVLDGGTGIDTMSGGDGNDTIYVDDARDVVIEQTGAGKDIVAARASYVLADGVEVENLRTTSQSGTTVINLTGNKLAQTITGNAAANILRDGGGAADILKGASGNDTYQIFSGGTKVIEIAGEGTADRVTAAVDYKLATGVSVENLTTNGSSATSGIDLTGNEFAQTIVANAGSNILDGKGGNDILKGLGGKDFFVFSTALGASNVDTITDFNVTDDTIRLENGIFTALTTTGALKPSFYKDNFLGTRDADDHIIYNSNTGSLFYDADGLGSGAAIKFATVATGLSLTAADFVVI